MSNEVLQTIDAADLSNGGSLGIALLELNNAHARELSWLEDRIVVAASARGRGCARRLYQDLFERAGCAGHERVVCEVNSRPPNPESDAFHTALGFVEIGSASIHEGRKTVRYLSRPLPYAALAGGRASTE